MTNNRQTALSPAAHGTLSLLWVVFALRAKNDPRSVEKRYPTPIPHPPICVPTSRGWPPGGRAGRSPPARLRRHRRAAPRQMGSRPAPRHRQRQRACRDAARQGGPAALLDRVEVGHVLPHQRRPTSHRRVAVQRRFGIERGHARQRIAHGRHGRRRFHERKRQLGRVAGQQRTNLGDEHRDVVGLWPGVANSSSVRSPPSITSRCSNSTLGGVSTTSSKRPGSPARMFGQLVPRLLGSQPLGAAPAGDDRRGQRRARPGEHMVAPGVIPIGMGVDGQHLPAGQMLTRDLQQRLGRAPVDQRRRRSRRSREPP